eukprot:TRINITY_DN1611_c0_g1_i4.p1 TRINITY_DN1611_c0_g1~~TRINITY_DN1611_c0_g1_i4.p1  ORF type:complete len:314 (+),score=-1.80 TRINITY_DN1611_c0_g1_i4:84-1025(+)
MGVFGNEFEVCVILPDGATKTYGTPMLVANVLQEFPQHDVVSSLKRPFSPRKLLHLGRTYVLQKRIVCGNCGGLLRQSYTLPSNASRPAGILASASLSSQSSFVSMSSCCSSASSPVSSSADNQGYESFENSSRQTSPHDADAMDSETLISDTADEDRELAIRKLRRSLKMSMSAPPCSMPRLSYSRSESHADAPGAEVSRTGSGNGHRQLMIPISQSHSVPTATDESSFPIIMRRSSWTRSSSISINGTAQDMAFVGPSIRQSRIHDIERTSSVSLEQLPSCQCREDDVRSSEEDSDLAAAFARISNEPQTC